MSSVEKAISILGLDTVSEPPLGKGKYGAVYHAKKHDKDYVVKISSTSVIESNNEPIIMNHLPCKCPYVICMSEFNHDANHNYLLIDYIADSVDMSTINFSEISMENKISLCHKLAIGLKYIHDTGVVHLDLKPANIMISKRDFSPIIIDFGLSFELDASKAFDKAIALEQYYIFYEKYPPWNIELIF